MEEQYKKTPPKKTQTENITYNANMSKEEQGRADISTVV